MTRTLDHRENSTWYWLVVAYNARDFMLVSSEVRNSFFVYYRIYTGTAVMLCGILINFRMPPVKH